MKNKQLKHISFILFFVIGSIPLWAQVGAPTPIHESGIAEWILNNIIFLMGSGVALGAFWAIVNLNNTILNVQKNNLLREQGIEVQEEIYAPEKESWLKKLYDKSWNVVPIEEEKNILLDHNYDGIRELDNVLPPWWLAMFWGCIIFGLGYLGYYHVWDYGQSSREAYTTEMEYAHRQVNAFLARQSDNVDENSVVIVEEEDKLALGEALFLANCATCHGQKGEGGIGPNLTDKYWLHGGTITDVFKTVKYGVPAKGMIAWKAQLRPSDIQNVSSYILGLQGTNPPNAKEPQGELIEDQPAEANETTSEPIGMK